MSIGVGVIGIGRMGDLFCRLLVQEPLSKLVAIADIDEERRNAAAATYDVPAYHDLHEMITRKDIDAVVIATSDQFHLEPSLAAAEAGKHIFIEKPLATRSSDARQIIDAAEAHHISLMVAHVLRFDPRFLIAQETIASGDLGDIVHLFVRYDARIATARYIRGRTTLSMFIGIHAIDMIHFLTGSRVVNVTAKAKSTVLREFGVNDSILSLFELENGGIGVLENSWIRPEGATDRIRSVFEVVGTSGRLQVDQGEAGLTIYRDTQVDYPDPMLLRQPKKMYKKITGAYREELVHFLECITDGRRPLVTGQAGWEAVVVAEAIDRSVNQGGKRIPIKWSRT